MLLAWHLDMHICIQLAIIHQHEELRRREVQAVDSLPSCRRTSRLLEQAAIGLLRQALSPIKTVVHEPNISA